MSVTFSAFAGRNLIADELAVDMSAGTCRTVLYLLGLSADFTGEVSPGALVKAGDAYIARVADGYTEPSELVATRVREVLALAIHASNLGATTITWG